jgi:hypothetical protein
MIFDLKEYKEATDDIVVEKWQITSILYSHLGKIQFLASIPNEYIPESQFSDYSAYIIQYKTAP